MAASRRGGRVRLVDEVAALYGQLGLRPVVLRPYFPQGKGFIERVNQYLETSFLPLRTFTGITDLQAQSDEWTTEVADLRRVRPSMAGWSTRWRWSRRAGGGVDALAVERTALRLLPAMWPDVDQHLEVRASSDSFVRVGGVDYSVPPRFARRRLAVRASLDHVAAFCDGEPVAAHARSCVRADVVIAAAHARELRLARQARRQLEAGDVEVAAPALGVYDQLAG
jgi:hypothetical protein